MKTLAISLFVCLIIIPQTIEAQTMAGDNSLMQEMKRKDFPAELLRQQLPIFAVRQELLRSDYVMKRMPLMLIAFAEALPLCEKIPIIYQGQTVIIANFAGVITFSVNTQISEKKSIADSAARAMDNIRQYHRRGLVFATASNGEENMRLMNPLDQVAANDQGWQPIIQRYGLMEAAMADDEVGESIDALTNLNTRAASFFEELVREIGPRNFRGKHRGLLLREDITEWEKEACRPIEALIKGSDQTEGYIFFMDKEWYLADIPLP